MKRYIQPDIEIVIYSQELMTLGYSDGEGDEHEFGNYGSFDDDLMMKSPTNHLWDNEDDSKKNSWL